MNLLQKLLVLLLFAGFYTSSYAAVSGIDLVSCGVYSDADGNGDKKDKKKDDQKEGEAEPDCE